MLRMKMRGPKDIFTGLAASAVAAFGLLLLYLGWVAVYSQVNPFDSFELLLNARGIATGEEYYYYWKRAPFLPALLSPFFYLERHFFSQPFGLMASRLSAVMFFAGFIWISFRIYRFHLSKKLALLGSSLLALNPLLIHYAPFTKEDIPASFFTALAFCFYVAFTRKKKWKYCLLTSVFISAAITTRYNFLPVLFLAIAAYELFSGETRIPFFRRTTEPGGGWFWRKMFFFFVAPLLFFFALHSVLFGRLGLASVWEGPGKVVGDMLLQFKFASGEDPWFETYQFLHAMYGWPLTAAAVWGFVSAWKKKRPGILFHSLWFGLFFLFQTYVIGHKEARYLFPCLISLHFFILCGVSDWVGFCRGPSGPGRQFPPLRRAGTVLIGILLFAWPVSRTIGECVEFRDPAYTQPFEKEVSRYAGELAGIRNVYWVGAKFPVHPRDYVFHSADDFTSIYHFYNHVAAFYLKRQVMVIEPDYPKILSLDEGDSGIFAANIGKEAEDGDVLIVNPAPRGYQTHNMPAKLPPLTVQRVVKYFFAETGPVLPGQKSFVSEQVPERRIDAFFSPEGTRFYGENFPDGYFEIYFFSPAAGEYHTKTVVRVRDGRFFYMEKGRRMTGLKKFYLLTYDIIKKLQVPGSE